MVAETVALVPSTAKTAEVQHECWYRVPRRPGVPVQKKLKIQFMKSECKKRILKALLPPRSKKNLQANDL